MRNIPFDEYREIIIGHSARRQLILVSFTESDDQVRIISVPAKRPAGSAKTMKKALVRKKKSVKPEELRPEYRFDYSKAKPNRFAARMSEGTVAIVLEPDVAAVFKSSEAVNALLRSIISAMPTSKRSSRAGRTAN